MLSERPVDEERVGLLASQQFKEAREEWSFNSTDFFSEKSKGKQEEFLEIEEPKVEKPI